jgi:GTP cyclohydrolase II
MTSVKMKAEESLIPSFEELLGRAESLVPVLRSRARSAEDLRRVPDETITDLREAGLFFVVSPKSEGGYGYGIEEFAAITRILARGCASTAWVYCFLVIHNVSLTQDTPALLKGEPFASAAFSAGFQATPSGTARPVEGGWLVSGRWPFASGVMNAEYFMLMTTEESTDDDVKVLGLVADVADVQIEDVWHFAGMAATGSNTVTLEDVFIPHDRQWTTFGQERLHPVDVNDVRPLEGFSIIRMFDATLPGIAVGCAEAALADMKARIGTRTVGFGLGPQREHREAWGRYGQAATEVRVARLVWEESVRTIGDYASRGESVAVEDAANLRMASVRICQIARDAIEIIAEGSGSSVYHLDNPLQRQQRDVNVLKNHSYLHPDGAYVPAGEALLGYADPVDALLVV